MTRQKQPVKEIIRNLCKEVSVRPASNTASIEAKWAMPASIDDDPNRTHAAWTIALLSTFCPPIAYDIDLNW
jgi:hypothetical protein